MLRSVQFRRSPDVEKARAVRPSGAVGGALRSTVRAAAMSSRPPVVVLPKSEGVDRALPRIRSRSWAAVAVGYFAASRAAAPVTWGVAIEVPLIVPYRADVATVERMLTPGAPMSTVL